MGDLRFNGGKFCALSGKGTFTELPTNTTVLSEVQIRAHLAGMVNGRIPTSLLPDILHEFTHHWCFLSPVGSTLSALHLRMIQRALTAETVEPVFKDVFRYETACALLRPISEGLALFGEFDVAPGATQYRSSALMWMLVYFNREGFGPGFSGPQADKNLHSLLSGMRKSGELWRKKESLLSMSAGLDHGGYLEGYLFIKNLWNRYRGRIKDPELFWGYLRSYFFDDYQLVQVLLKEPDELLEIITGLLSYWAQRLILLDIQDLEQAINQYHDETTSIPFSRGRSKAAADELPFSMPETQSLRGLLNDPDLAAEGAGLGSRLFVDVQQNIPGLSEVITNYTRHTLGRRELVCIAHSPAYVRINEHRRAVVIGDGFVAGAPALPGVEPTEGEGAMEFYLSTLGAFDAFVTSINGKPVAIYFSGKNDPPAELVEGFLDNVLDRSIVMSTQETLDKAIEDLLLKQEAGKDLPVVRDIIKRKVDEMYLDTVLLDALPARREGLSNDLRASGLWKPLGSNLELIGGTAAASLLRAAGLRAGDIDADLAERGVSYDSVLENLKSLRDSTGLNFVDEEERAVLI